MPRGEPGSGGIAAAAPGGRAQLPTPSPGTKVSKGLVLPPGTALLPRDVGGARGRRGQGDFGDLRLRFRQFKGNGGRCSGEGNFLELGLREGRRVGPDAPGLRPGVPPREGLAPGGEVAPGEGVGGRFQAGIGPFARAVGKGGGVGGKTFAGKKNSLSNFYLGKYAWNAF